MESSSDGEDVEGNDDEMPTLCYRQRLEKSTGGEVVLMEWSPTMDLLAVAFADHSVVLNRLAWQRVWTIPSAKFPVTAITWRPDGKVLAIGHKDGCVRLHNVEDGQVLNEFPADAAISSLHWTQLHTQDSGSVDGGAEKLWQEEAWSNFLPHLPSVESRDKNHPQDPKHLQPLKYMTLHVLLIGDEVGRVHVCVFGIFLVATMSAPVSDVGHVIMSRMSCDFKEVLNLSFTHPQMDSCSLTLQQFDTSLLSRRARELHQMGLEFGHVTCHMEYMSSTFKAMYEDWDDLLFNLDSQLAGYSKTLPEGRTVGDEFLILLACGRASQELQDFLVSELTAKGVKKLGLSLEHSYEHIRKYLLHHFQSALQALLLHLGKVLGMARWQDRFDELGLSEAAVQKCINVTGTLALKSQEMLLAIDQSLQSIKVFFTWLFVVILKLSNEQVPKGLKEDISPEELKLIMNFLKKRLKKAEQGEHAFNLEIVGQYLSNEDLKIVEEKKSGVWDGLLKSAQLDSGSIPWLFKPSPTKSLLQLFKALHAAIERAFTSPIATIQKSLTPELCSSMNIKCEEKLTVDRLNPLMCHFTHEDTVYLCRPVSIGNATPSTPSLSCSEFMVVSTYPQRHHQEVETVREKSKFCIREVESLREKAPDQVCSIISLQRYDSENLSVLFQYSFTLPEDPMSTDADSARTVTRSVVAQLPVGGVASLSCDSDGAVEDVGPLLTQVHSLGGFKGGMLAVSGNRKLAAVLSQNRKKIQLFDVDAEEDTDE